MSSFTHPALSFIQDIRKVKWDTNRGAFQYLSSQRPLRILDIFDQTAVEVWKRKTWSLTRMIQKVEVWVRQKLSHKLVDEKKLKDEIPNGLAFLPLNICLVGDNKEY